MEKLERIAQYLLDTAKEAGADDVLCVVNETETNEFNMLNGEFSMLRTMFDRSVQLSLLMDHRKGTITVNSFEEEALLKAVEDCIASAKSAEPDAAWEFDPEPRDESFTEGTLICEKEKLFERTQELVNSITERHPKIMIEELYTDHRATRTVLKTSVGVTSRISSGCYNVSLTYSAHEGEKGTNFYYGDTKLITLDKPFIDCGLIEWELDSVERQLDSAPLSGKFTGTVVLAPNALADLVSGTMTGNFLSDTPLIDGTSIWKDKLGESVADEQFTLSFEPYAADVVAGDRFTEEGYRTEDFDVIREGKLTSFMLSQYGANKTGGVRAGITGYLPYPHIPAGDKTLDEIIGGIRRGVLVMRFSGGEPAPSGEFSAVAKNSFLIENGKIATALVETMISGNVADMLKNIRAISRDVLKDGYGSVPFMAFDGVTVSGK